jgi:hypothetical protein
MGVSLGPQLLLDTASSIGDSGGCVDIPSAHCCIAPV